jgi:hypothetical protein
MSEAAVAAQCLPALLFRMTSSAGLPREERGEVGHLAPGNVVPQPAVDDGLRGCVCRHPGLRAGDRLPRDNRVTFASSPENRRPLSGQDLIAGLSVINDETRQLHAVLETPGSTAHQLQHHRAALGKPQKTGRWRWGQGVQPVKHRLSCVAGDPGLRVPDRVAPAREPGVAARLGVRRAHRRHDHLGGEQMGEGE